MRSATFVSLVCLVTAAAAARATGSHCARDCKADVAACLAAVPSEPCSGTRAEKRLCRKNRATQRRQCHALVRQCRRSDPGPGLCVPTTTTTLPTCPGAVVGDPTGTPTVSIVGLTAGSTSVRGRAMNVDASRAAVVGWAYTNAYYVQPFTDSPFTAICSDASWSMYTHPWTSFVVLLVDRLTFHPPDIDYTHPSLLPGVLAWDEFPPARTVQLGGYTFAVKASYPIAVDPGPCAFSNSEQNVSLDSDGLHLRTVQQADQWTCSEVVLDHSLGYGTYSWQIGNDLSSIDSNAVAAGFVYEDIGKEFDIEVSQALVPAPNGIQTVVQPYTTPGNLMRFPLPATTTSTNRIVWQPDHIQFTSWKGTTPYPPDPADVIESWTYTGADIPTAGSERMRFNVWMFGGRPPATNAPSEMIVRSFTYQP